MNSEIILPPGANGSKLRLMVGAVIYIRVSTKEQTENLSLSTQLKACEEYCERQGFEARRLPTAPNSRSSFTSAERTRAGCSSSWFST
jgi:DNA invertase Pin-like site-specific DNA recombinase